MVSGPLKNAGPSTGQIVSNLNGLLDEYYETFGYSKEGVPTPEMLEDLGLGVILTGSIQ